MRTAQARGGWLACMATDATSWGGSDSDSDGSSCGGRYTQGAPVRVSVPTSGTAFAGVTTRARRRRRARARYLAQAAAQALARAEARAEAKAHARAVAVARGIERASARAADARLYRLAQQVRARTGIPQSRALAVVQIVMRARDWPAVGAVNRFGLPVEVSA
jgi:hypothetical protein